jgi:hypothetical protein
MAKFLEQRVRTQTCPLVAKPDILAHAMSGGLNLALIPVHSLTTQGRRD